MIKLDCVKIVRLLPSYSHPSLKAFWYYYYIGVESSKHTGVMHLINWNLKSNLHLFCSKAVNL